MGGTKRKSTKKENILDGFGNDQFINQMLQNNNSGDQLPELGLVDDLGMDTTDIKESMIYDSYNMTHTLCTELKITSSTELILY